MENLNILCLGDSLTAGYSDCGETHTPYGAWIEESLTEHWPKTKTSVTVAGRSGDCVGPPGGSFLTRLNSRLREAETTGKKFDWIIILGGTNDLAYGRDAPGIFIRLQELWEIASAYGACVLQLTIPECAANIAALNARRDDLNSYLLARGQNPDKAYSRFFTLDTHKLLPYHTLSEEEVSEIWDDGLHFKPYGYGLLAHHVTNRLVELIEGMGSEAAVNNSVTTTSRG